MSSTLESRGFIVHTLSPLKHIGDVEPADEYQEWLGAEWQTDAIETTECLRHDPVDWVVIDHYAIDIKWEKKIRKACKHIMVIDDLANRRHDCDILLDQNYYEHPLLRYHALVPDAAKLLLGPKYLLMRSEFYQAKNLIRIRNGQVRKILVFFGGTDPTNQTFSALIGVESIDYDNIHVDVVVGSTNPNKDQISRYCNQRTWVNYHCQVTNMAELISSADLAIGAGGSAMWERCALGLPTLTVVFAQNQVKTTEEVANTGAIKYLGWARNITADDYADEITSIIRHPEELKKISKNAVDLIEMADVGGEHVLKSMILIENSCN